MDEWKPLHQGHHPGGAQRAAANREGCRSDAVQARNGWQGLPLVHFSSTQAGLVSEQFCVQLVTSYDPLILSHAIEITQRIPQKVMTLI